MCASRRWMVFALAIAAAVPVIAQRFETGATAVALDVAGALGSRRRKNCNRDRTRCPRPGITTAVSAIVLGACSEHAPSTIPVNVPGGVW
jgi:hypothetical protein